MVQTNNEEVVNPQNFMGLDQRSLKHTQTSRDSLNVKARYKSRKKIPLKPSG